MIPEEDYKQVFEETIMSVIEGLIKHGKKADINAKEIIIRWARYYHTEMLKKS
jgi:hypothetical protein